METEGVVHRLAAIISGDIVGYSRLIGTDEAAAVRLVTAYREEVELLVRQNQGQLVDFTGDSFLAYFSSSLAAVSCAIEIQGVLRARNQNLPDDRKMQFRLGIHQGDVRIEGDRVFGTGVNVAARLEPMADPGGICISGSVKDQLQGRMELQTDDLGSQTVKNISEPIRVYRLIFGENPEASAAKPTSSGSRFPLKPGIAAAAFFAMIAAGVGIWRMGESVEVEAELPAGPQAEAPGVVKSAVGVGSPDLADSIEPSRPSIVVLPFNNMSGEAEQEYFADGISEDLTTDLSKIHHLFVIARNSAFTYKGKPIDVEAVGRELGVRYVLEGSVRKVQDRVRINAQLIDAATGFHVWSQRYDRELSDVFSVQNEISEKILSALRINIEEAELERIRRHPTENLNAYEAWHKGRTLTRGLTRATVAEGRRLLEYAIELEPDYADAYASMSNSYMAEFVGWNLDPALNAKARKMAERAMELSPRNPLSLTCMAAVEMGRFRPDKAIVLAKRATELAPSDYVAFSVLGIAEIQMGDFEAGRSTLEQAVRLNPLAIDLNYTMLGFAQLETGDAESAVALWERVRSESPEALPDRLFLAQYYESAGESDRAKAIVSEILEVNPHYTAEQAVDYMRILGAFPEDMEPVVTGNFKLAGLP